MIAFLLFTTLSYASEYIVRYNVNVHNPYSTRLGLSVGQQFNTNLFAYRYELGYLSDKLANSRLGWVQVGMGLEPTYGPIYLSYFQSIGSMSKEDKDLSGYFQFFEDIGIGWKDKKNGSSIGIGFKHISNAGLKQPNNGKDLFNVLIKFPLPF